MAKLLARSTTKAPARAASARATSLAYVLHSHDWSESSLILELFCREQGKVLAVAKGAKRPYSQLRPVLMPFQRIQVAFGAKRADEAEVWLLRHAEWAGGPAWPGGAALLPAFYLNELLMRLLARHDPHPELFDAYADALQGLTQPALLTAALRAFELVLLRQLGHLPDLSQDTVDASAVRPGQGHTLHPELGVRTSPWLVDANEPGARGDGPVQLDGGVLLALEQALSRPVGDGRSVVPGLMAACVTAGGLAMNDLKAVTRTLLHYHLGSHTLRTRQLMIELQQP
ncbi:DNA repair protein RecO [Aquabacterium sp.]|uniref:DNA repair protein RecO n=1 Tax=Aquabacterium sp. TaxID=1872578 RepID=UPI0035C6690F